jgi:PIN domain nuclease of toxin-antitoxin system
MKLLLDSHALIWAVDHPSKLSGNAKIHLEDPANELFISAATIWEIAIKVGLGKLTLSFSYQIWIEQAIRDLGASILPITVEFAAAQSQLPNHHRDPFDRMLVAQSLVANISLVSGEALLDNYGISRIW